MAKQYKSKYTGAQIDKAVGDVLEGRVGEVPAERKVGGVNLENDTANLQGYTWTEGQTMAQKMSAIEQAIDDKQAKIDAGHILTNSLPVDFITRIHQDPTQVATWKEYPEASGVPAGTNSEQAEAQPRSGYIPYDKDLTTNGKQYLIVYEGNAAQALEVTFGGGYSPITTSMFTNDGDGTTQNDPYAKMSDIKLASALTASVTVGDSWPAGTSIETILRALLDPQQP